MTFSYTGSDDPTWYSWRGDWTRESVYRLMRMTFDPNFDNGIAPPFDDTNAFIFLNKNPTDTNNYGATPTKLWWDAVPFTTISIFSGATKPSWEEVQRLWRHYRARQKGYQGLVEERALTAVVRHFDGLPVTHEISKGVGLHVDEGLGHMPSAIHLVEAGTLAGQGHPRMALRNADGDVVDMWAERHKRSIVGDLSKRTNSAESAKNILRKKYNAISAELNVPRPTAIPSEEDEQKLTSILNRLLDGLKAENIVAEFRTLMDAINDPAALPPDLPTVKVVLAERLEARATGHQKALKGALTQQAIDNWASCVDMDEALQEVAKECVLGTLRIGNATESIWKKVGGAWEAAPPRTGAVDHEGEGDPSAALGVDGELYRDTGSGIPNAKAAFEAAVAKIEAVSPLNTPVITYNISGRRVTIRAEQPSVDPPVEGPLGAPDSGLIGLEGTDIRQGITTATVGPLKDTDPRIERVDFDPAFAGKVRITMTIRNLCGPTDFSLDLDIAANGSISVAA